MHIVGQLQSQIQSLTLESRAYYASIDNNSLYGNMVLKKIHNLTFHHDFTIHNFTCFDGTSDSRAHILHHHMLMSSYYND